MFWPEEFTEFLKVIRILILQPMMVFLTYKYSLENWRSLKMFSMKENITCIFQPVFFRTSFKKKKKKKLKENGGFCDQISRTAMG